LGNGAALVEQSSPGSGNPGDTLRFRLNLAGDSNRVGQIELPAVAADRIDPAWLGAQRSAIPDELRRAIEQAGHRVQRRAELWPIELEDGRRLVVPVEQVDVHYRPRLAY
jgi:hypothetical protein